MTFNDFTTLNKTLTDVPAHLHPMLGQSYREDEAQFVERLLKEVELTPVQQAQVENHARELVKVLREERMQEGGLEAFLFQYDLSSEEGIALMCMAEALLRIPDKHTMDKLIKDKLTQGDWESHLGKSHSMFVNAATWGLMLTGKVFGEHQSLHHNATEQSATLRKGLLKLAGKGGEPLVRQVVYHAMKILGKQFVMGRSIEEALKRSKTNESKGYRYSYDMLGEAAYTEEDAQQYDLAYRHAIEMIANHAKDLDPIDGPGISIKLSALHPRFEVKKRTRLKKELLKRVKGLAYMAQSANMNLTLDAEEADTLVLLLEVYAELARDPKLKHWKGLGLAVQAYQKRAADVIDWLNEVAQQENQSMMVRLVKGAYWDTEIKWAQLEGLEGYPVFTRKCATDVNYLYCAQKLLQGSDLIYPQFATHNGHTVASLMSMAEQAQRTHYEFQCLHGMGTPLFDQLVTKPNSVPCRIYAPVGTHEDLLAYLVRRLLENGANTSFVNRIVNEELPISEIIANPIQKLRNADPKPHPQIPLPRYIFDDRHNSKGIDLNNPLALQKTLSDLDLAFKPVHARPTGTKQADALDTKEIHSPFDKKKKLGTVAWATADTVEKALAQADKAFLSMPAPQTRAKQLNKLADILENRMAAFMTMATLEGGKTLDDAVAEVREAVDFCRYYANEALRIFEPQVMPGPTGEYNELSLMGRGVLACVSPWNFPLAIFIGQVTASYAAGNCVMAKPASQTPLIAYEAIQACYEAGISQDHIQYMPGSGSVVGEKLIQDPRIKGVLFTGSTDTARHINIKLANRPGPIIPFIAETGGQNALIVDSSALPEQVVQDVVFSAFRSAGQRCSALRVLFVQEDIADKMLTMLEGAMAELKVGNPIELDTDVGPVIDDKAKQQLNEHITWLEKNAKKLCEVPLKSPLDGTFVNPCAFEISSIDQIKQENFGPILHVVRYHRHDLDKVIDSINATGFGLTFGIHSRIDEKVAHVFKRIKVGNMYVNRNIIGAVVGVQPFGGEGLSGTGPKAGGPHYLLRLVKERSLSINTTAAGGNASLMSLSPESGL